MRRAHGGWRRCWLKSFVHTHINSIWSSEPYQDATRLTDVHGIEVAPQLLNFENDPSRFSFEVGLQYYNAARHEVDRAVQRIDQNFTYLVTVAAAVIASQIAFSDAFAVLDEHPTTYLLLVLIGLWFPINHTLLSVDLAAGGAFLRWRLLPALDKLATEALPDVNRRAGVHTAASELATLNWESFRSALLFERGTAYYFFNPLWFLKAGLLYTPSAAFLVRYGSERLCLCIGDPISVWEYALLIVVGVTSLLNQVVNWRFGNLPRLARLGSPLD